MDYWDAEATLRAMYKLGRPKRSEDSLAMLQKMPSYAERCQISIEDIDNLNIIHVTGTKGKGSTCALTESILHSHGYRTGTFISPHVLHTKERIRINGTDLQKDRFAEYFSEVHEKFLYTKDECDGDMPYRFQFYTLFALHVFIHEKVDVCILEVGVGGETDCTNFIRKPWLCAIASIDLDHVKRLGDTKEKIAWQKAGIFKEGCTAFVGNIVKDSVLDVIRSRAIEKQIQVYGVPKLADYETNGKPVTIGINGDVQKYNASLALQLAKAWIDRKENQIHDIDSSLETDYSLPVSKSFALTDSMFKGLAGARILGRGDIIRKEGITYYLDVAHTVDSIKFACDWFFENVGKGENTKSGKAITVMIFDLLPWRDAPAIISSIVDQPFDAVLFTTSNIRPGAILPSRYDGEQNVLEQMETRTLECKGIWHALKGIRANMNDVFYSVQESLAWATQGRDPEVFNEPTYPILQLAARPNCARETFDLKSIPEELRRATHIHIFVTGHTKVVGNVFSLISNED